MYVFGGKNDSSEKLNDLWVYNIGDKRWVEVIADGEAPYERSGHSSDVYDDYLVIFGGIFHFFVIKDTLTQDDKLSSQISCDPLKLPLSEVQNKRKEEMTVYPFDTRYCRRVKILRL